jgi:acyl-CoA synthetase (NDP forming)
MGKRRFLLLTFGFVFIHYEFGGMCALYVHQRSKETCVRKMPAPGYASLFNPESIALIGASKHVEKWGAIVFLNILLGGYPGRLYPVNPNEQTIFGHKAYPRVSASLMGEGETVPKQFPFPLFRTPESVTGAASALYQYARYRSILHSC